MGKKKKSKNGQPAPWMWDEAGQSSRSMPGPLRESNAPESTPSNVVTPARDHVDGISDSVVAQTHRAVISGHSLGQPKDDCERTSHSETARLTPEAFSVEDGFEFAVGDAEGGRSSSLREEGKGRLSPVKLDATTIPDTKAPSPRDKPGVYTGEAISTISMIGDYNIELDHAQRTAHVSRTFGVPIQDNEGWPSDRGSSSEQRQKSLDFLSSESAIQRSTSFATAETEDKAKQWNFALETWPGHRNKKDLGVEEFIWGYTRPENNDEDEETSHAVAGSLRPPKSKNSSHAPVSVAAAAEVPINDEGISSPTSGKRKSKEIAEQSLLNIPEDMEAAGKCHHDGGHTLDTETEHPGVDKEYDQSSLTALPVERDVRLDYNQTSAWQQKDNSDEDSGSEYESWPEYSPQQRHTEGRNHQATGYYPYPGPMSYPHYRPPYLQHMQPYPPQYPFYYQTPYGLAPLQEPQYYGMRQGSAILQPSVVRGTNRTRKKVAASSRQTTLAAEGGYDRPNVSYPPASAAHQENLFGDLSFQRKSPDISSDVSQSKSAPRAVRHPQSHVSPPNMRSKVAISPEHEKRANYNTPTCEDYNSDEGNSGNVLQPSMPKDTGVDSGYKLQRSREEISRPSASDRRQSQPLYSSLDRTESRRRRSKAKARPTTNHASRRIVFDPAFAPGKSRGESPPRRQPPIPSFSYASLPSLPDFSSLPFAPFNAPAPSAPALPTFTSELNDSASDPSQKAAPSPPASNAQVVERSELSIKVPPPHYASLDVEMATHNDKSLVQTSRSEGLVIAVSVQCSHATLHSRFSTLLHQNWPERTASNDLGDIFVKKAVNAKRFKKRDGSHSIELSCDNGPSITQLDNAYQLQWL